MAWTTPGTAVAGDVLTAAFWNTQVRDNLIELAPFSAAWTSYTSTIGNGWTLGTGTITASYLQVGKFVAVRLKFTVGNGTKGAGIPTFTLPTNAISGGYFGCDADLNDNTTDNILGKATINTAAFGTNVLAFQYMLIDGSVLKFRSVSSTAPFTWVATDSMELRGPLIYQAA